MFTPRVELYVDGAWTDYTDRIRLEDAVTITRGRENEQGELAPSRCTMTINNRDGVFSNRNPMSPLYGLIGRNTPIRVTMTGLAPALTLGAAGRAYAADTAALDITGDIDIRADIEPDFWAPAVRHVVASKSSTTGDQRSWYLALADNGTIEFGWSSNGLFPFTTVKSTVATRLFGRATVRVTLDVDDGGDHTVTFYTGESVGTATEVLGDPVTNVGTTSVFAGTAALEAGTANTGTIPFVGDARFAGYIHRLQVRDGIGGTVVADADFNAQADGATSFSDGIQTWTLTGGSSLTGDRVRLVAEVPHWPTRWDRSGKDVYVPIEASGITRRLTQGASPLRSAIYRNLTQYAPIGYWPLEDASGSESAASAVDGGQPAKVTAVTFAADDTLPGSATALTLDDTTSRITGAVRRALSPTSTGWSFLLLFKLPAIPGADTKLISWSTSGSSVTTWQLVVGTATYKLYGYDSSGTEITFNLATFGTGASPNGWIAMQVETSYAAGTTTWSHIWHRVGTDTFYTSPGDSYAGNPGNIRGFSVVGQTYLTGASMAHVYAGENTLPFAADTFAASSNGYRGETAVARFQRLCAEEGVTAVVQTTGSDSSAQMGPQRVATFMELIGECQDADLGALYEPRDQLALGYWPRTSLYSGRGPTFSYGQHIAEPFEPVDDDQAIINAITVTRPGGSSATAELLDGALSVQPPPAGVGRYDSSVDANVYSDDQLTGMAEILLHLGTWDALRYPKVSLKLTNASFLGFAQRTLDAARLDVASRLTIDSLPPWLPPDPADCLVQGYTETFSPLDWDITFNTTPGDLWDIGYADGDAARADTEGAELDTAVDDTATTLIMTTTSGPAASTDPDDYPVDIGMAGEQITLGTPPSGDTSPQTFTGVTRSVNGVVKEHPAGTAIALWKGAYTAL